MAKAAKKKYNEINIERNNIKEIMAKKENQ